MDDFNTTLKQIPSQKIIQMIQQFVGCLNYPNTKAILIKEKIKNNYENKQEMINQQEVMKMEDQLKDDVKIQEESQQKEGKQKNQMKEEQQQKDKQIEAKHQVLQNQNVQQKSQQIHEQRNLSQKQQFTWRAEQAKFYSKFATFSQIVYCLETSSTQRQLANVKLRQAELLNTNNQILQNCINSKPTLLHLFSTFDAFSKIKQFTVPVYRNLSIQPKFSKPTNFIQASPKQNYLCIVDKNSSVSVINLTQLCLIHYLKFEQADQITSILWLKTGNMFAIGTKSGKFIVYSVTQRSINKVMQQLSQNCQITSMCCNKQFLYACRADFSITKTIIRYWKTQKITNLKGNWLKKLVKIDHKKLKDIIFGIDRDGTQVVMIDQQTGYQSILFTIKRNHLQQCIKIYEKKDSKDSKIYLSQIIKNCYISDILANTQNSTLIICVAGINPSIYQIDPLRNQVISRLNYRQLKSSFFSHDLESISKRTTSNIYMSLSHKSQLLTVTTNSNIILYVRLKNWRVLYQYNQLDKNIVFGQITSTRRYPDADQSLLIFTQIQPQLQQFLSPSIINQKKIIQQNINRNKSRILQKQQKLKQKQQKRQCIICVHNKNNQNIQIYYNHKAQMKTLRSDNVRNRPFLSVGIGGFPTSAQGFLELLQTIRQNYQAFT